jgi:DNA-binding response OmpR family regulator
MALQELLRDEGYEVISATGREEGVTLATMSHADVIIADARLPGLDGVAWVRELSRYGPPPPTILLCTRASCPPPESGVVCMTKPIDLARLFRVLERAAGPQILVA